MNTRFDQAKAILESHRGHLSRLGSRHLAIFGSTAGFKIHMITTSDGKPVEFIITPASTADITAF